MRDRTIILTESQVWIMFRALTILSSPEQAQKIEEEFPLLDFDMLGDDLCNIIDQLEMDDGEENEHCL